MENLENIKIDYNQYQFTKGNWIEYSIKVILKTFLISYLFFDSYKAVLLGIPIGFEIYNSMKKVKIEERKKELLYQFKEMMQVLLTSLSAGYSLEQAMILAKKDMLLIFEEKSLIMKEMNDIERGLEINIPIEKLFQDFGRRSNNEDIKNFANVLVAAKRNGGNINRMIHKTINSITDKWMVEEEIQTMITAKKLEVKIMTMMPYIMIFYLQFTNREFFGILYHNFIGQIIMIVYLVVIYIAEYWGNHIMEIRV